MTKSNKSGNNPDRGWLRYQFETFLGEGDYPLPILCPLVISVKANEHKVNFEMKRIPTPRVAEMLPSVLDSLPNARHDSMTKIFKHYLGFFTSEGKENPIKDESPLDLKDITSSTILLIYLQTPNWAFSGHRQFTCPNDDPYLPKAKQISTFNQQKGILVRRAAELDYDLKYDFHVTVYEDDGRSTEIIIDPRDDDRPD